MCLYPRLMLNPKYKKNKKNGGYIPQCKDERTLYVPVKCGYCIECYKQKSNEWRIRLNEEIRNNNEKKYFVTLTYKTESLKKLYSEIKSTGYKRDNDVATLSIRRFTERWRKKYKKTIRHWTVTELGNKNWEHLHIHGILMTNHPVEEIEKIWQYGNVKIGTYVNERTINYIIKYITKANEIHKTYKPIILTSKGIGKGYTDRLDSTNNKYIKNKTNELYTTRQGNTLQLPIYYRNKIYTEEEREKLWIEKLEKNERWVMGEKIDMNQPNAEHILQRTQEYYRNISKRMNYIEPPSDDRKEYENKRRTLIQNKRMEETPKQELRYTPKQDEW